MFAISYLDNISSLNIWLPSIIKISLAFDLSMVASINIIQWLTYWYWVLNVMIWC